MMQRNTPKIPEGWSVKKLGDIVSKISRRNILNNTNVVTISAQKGFIKQEQFFNKSVAGSDLTNYYLLEKGDFGYNRSYSKGYPLGAIKRVDNYDYATVSTLYICFRPLDKVNSDYLLQYFETGLQHFELYKIVQEGARNHGLLNVSLSDFFDIKLILPPLAEQEKIAEILGTWDEAIEKLSSLIEQKKLLKKGLMQKLLTGKVRPPGFTQPWKEVKLGEIGTISSAGVDKKIVEGEDLVELLNYMDVYKKDFLYKTDTSMTVSAPMRQIKNCNLRKGDIFFTPSSETPDDIAHSAVVMEDIPNGVYSYHIIRLRPTTLIDLKFSAYAFKTAKFYKQAYAWCEGSGQRYVISQDDFRNMKIYIPSNISEQHAIAEVLSTADDEINLLNQKLEATKEQKKGLMQQLLTGQVRVKVN